MKLKDLVNEGWFDERNESQPKYTLEDRQHFLETVRNFNEIGKSIYREANLIEIAKTLSKICEFAEMLTINETDEWFDRVSIQKNMKELNGASQNFAKIATEAQKLQERLTVFYEDIGNILNRYFEISDLQTDSDEKAVQPETNHDNHNDSEDDHDEFTLSDIEPERQEVADYDPKNPEGDIEDLYSDDEDDSFGDVDDIQKEVYDNPYEDALVEKAKELFPHFLRQDRAIKLDDLGRIATVAYGTSGNFGPVIDRLMKYENHGFLKDINGDISVVNIQ